MELYNLKAFAKKQSEISKVRRLAQRAFGKRRGVYHYEYLD